MRVAGHGLHSVRGPRAPQHQPASNYGSHDPSVAPAKSRAAIRGRIPASSTMSPYTRGEDNTGPDTALQRGQPTPRDTPGGWASDRALDMTRASVPVIIQNGSACTSQPPGGGLSARRLGLKECRCGSAVAQGLAELAP